MSTDAVPTPPVPSAPAPDPEPAATAPADEQVSVSTTEDIGFTVRDEETGEELTPQDVMRKLNGLDPRAIYTEMKRRINMALLPWSLFYRGSAFRAWVADIEAQHGERPATFSYGDSGEIPIPPVWPDDPYWDVPRENYVARYFTDTDRQFDDPKSRTLARFFLDRVANNVAEASERV